MAERYASVPKDPAANLDFRASVLARAGTDKAFREDQKKICRDEPLYFVNTFCWLYDPGVYGDKPGVVPFCTFAFQDEFLLAVWDAIGRYDIGAEKSRAQGATYCVLTAFFQRWCFEQLYSFLLITRNQDLVDNPKDPDSLFWKLDFLYERLPAWLRPQRDRNYSDATMVNMVNRSVFTGTATTMAAGAGGRKSAALIDEHAKFQIKVGYSLLKVLQFTTNCRVQVSTPDGAVGAFYDTMARRKEGRSFRKFRLHWSKNPVHAKGLYTSEGGLLKLLDEPYWSARGLEGYDFVLDDRVRSPWYDFQCERAITAREIPEELDIDYLGSGGAFFDRKMIGRITKEHVREADFRGEFIEGRMIPHMNGHLWMWFDPRKGPPSGRRIVLGCDIALGTGASNSTCCGYDMLTGEKLLEFASADVRASDFATFVHGLAVWLGGPEFVTIIWERNAGPGRNFGDVLYKEIGYRNVYWDPGLDSRGRKRKHPGWWSGREAKKAILTDYGDCLSKTVLINRSREAMRECAEYVTVPGGGLEHVREREVEDPSGAGDNHGDRVIADALCAKIIRKLEIDTKAQPVVAPPNSFQGRFERVEAARRREKLLTFDWSGIHNKW